jgi:DNA invertase Pin-like site-specific DNA recombinase
MALVGLVRVSTSKQEVARQHDALGGICVKVFEEKISGKLRIADRPGMQAALDYMRHGDMLTVQEADRLGRNLLEGLIVLTELFEAGIAVKILEGIAAGEHTERSLILDLALALAEDRRRDIARKTRNGLDAAARRGRKGGRPRVVDEDKQRAILARRSEGQSLREIARGVGISLAVVHGVVQAAANGNGERTQQHPELPEPQASEGETVPTSETTATPIQELSGDGGLTHHQTTPLRQHGITTVEQLAELVDAHRANPDGSELSTVAGFGRKRVELACTAVDRWRERAGAATSSRKTS